MVTMQKNHYVPALKYSWLTRFYDPVVALTSREKVFRENLLKQAEIRTGDRILDLACGTGTFAVMVKSRYPDVKVAGLDVDPRVLALAREKTQKAGVDVLFEAGVSVAMPYDSGVLDIVFSSLFFHHLNTVDKLLTMKDVLRVLKPGGTFHICDWGRPSNLFAKMMFNTVRALDGFSLTHDNAEGRLPFFIEKVGFIDVCTASHVETMLGTLDLITAKKPVN